MSLYLKIEFDLKYKSNLNNLNCINILYIMDQSQQTMPILLKQGYLEIWLGPMFSGKTSKLIETYKKYTYIGKKTLVVNYAEDMRYHKTMLSTHDKIMIPCVQTIQLNNIREQLLEADVILINEGQFFQDLFSIVVEMVDVRRKTIYISALDGDFLRQRFGQVLDLIPHSNAVTKLSALCAECKNGKAASFSYRLSNEVGQVVIGSDNYVPLCRSCYLAH